MSFKKAGLVAAAAAALWIAAPASASDIVYPGGGTLAQVVDGGGAYSIITLLNLDTIAIPYNLYFFSDNGSPLTLTTSIGVANSGFLNGIIPVGGSVIIRTNGACTTSTGLPCQGYAVVTSESINCYGYGEPGYTGICQIAGSTVFGLTLNGTVLEASCPLDTGDDYIIAFPFDSTTSVTGVALANSPGDSEYQYTGRSQIATLSFNFLNQQGTSLGTGSLTLNPGQHTAFLLSTQFPQQTAGQTGMVVITATDPNGNPYFIKTLGLRVNNANTTYTSVTPVIPCNFYYSSSTGGFCTN